MPLPATHCSSHLTQIIADYSPCRFFIFPGKFTPSWHYKDRGLRYLKYSIINGYGSVLLHKNTRDWLHHCENVRQWQMPIMALDLAAAKMVTTQEESSVRDYRHAKCHIDKVQQIANLQRVTNTIRMLQPPITDNAIYYRDRIKCWQKGLASLCSLKCWVWCCRLWQTPFSPVTGHCTQVLSQSAVMC